MNNIFMQLEHYKKFSHNEKIIVDFILKHPDQVLNMNTAQLAKTCLVLVTTIYRLCEKIKLSGFQELKVKISQDIAGYMKKPHEFDFDFPIKQNQTHFEIMTRLKEDYEKTVDATFQLFLLDELKKAVHALKKAQHIDIYTSAGNINIAQNFAFQMQEIGVRVNVPIEEYQQRLIASCSDSTHLAIMITFGGRGLLTQKIAHILHKTKTPILLISSCQYEMDIDVNYHLYMSSYENHYKKISSYSTRLSLLYIMDVLYTCYFEMDYEMNMKRKLNYYHIMIDDEKIFLDEDIYGNKK